MAKASDHWHHALCVHALLFLALAMAPSTALADHAEPEALPGARLQPYPASELDLASIPFRIVYETFRQTDGKENWELCLVHADGSNPINLTRTADVNELYPHASPDGTKVCFVADEGTGRDKMRNVYYMNLDGTGRVKVAENARQPCWSPDSRTIAYLKAEYRRYTITDYATKELMYYDLKTGEHKPHLNKDLHHLYNICWSPDGNWFAATVHGGMGHDHAILVLQAHGTAVYDLTKFGVTGCRPDFSPDGRRITWGLTDWDLGVADIDLSAPEPVVTDVRPFVKCDKEHETYHTDFSPDGQYIAFGYGPKANEMVGGQAPGWNICVSDLAGKWVQITTDGCQNKEPDWVPAPAKAK